MLTFKQITTTNIRVKEVLQSKEEVAENGDDGGVAKEGRGGSVLYEFPLFSVSYCGTNQTIEEAFSFVAKDTDGRSVYF